MAKKATKPRGHTTLIQRSRSVSPSFKAAIHQNIGAGRSRVKRQFFGLSDADKAAIFAAINDGIGKNLRG